MEMIPLIIDKWCDSKKKKKTKFKTELNGDDTGILLARKT